MPTYPKFPQPIVKGLTGRNWYIEVTNAGLVQVGGTTTDPPTDTKRMNIISTDRARAWNFGLTIDFPGTPAVLLTEIPVHQGRYEDLFVFSPNGKEWALQVSNAGSVTVKAMSDTERLVDPIITDPSGKKWHFTVANTGIYSVTDESITKPTTGSSVNIVSQDGTKAFILTVANTGIISVDELVTTPEDATYEVELISPDLTTWVLTINQSGILSISDAPSPAAVRDVWTVVMARDNKTLYVVDPRFRNPFKGSRGWKNG